MKNNKIILFNIKKLSNLATLLIEQSKAKLSLFILLFIIKIICVNAQNFSQFVKIIDSTNKLTETKILQLRAEGKIKGLNTADQLVYTNNKNHWFYLEIDNKSRQNLVITSNFMLYNTTAHFYDSSFKLIKKETVAFNINYFKRKLIGFTNTFEVPNQSKIICIIKTQTYAFTGAGILLFPFEKYHNKEFWNSLFNGIFIGIFFLAVLYTFFFGIIRKDKIYAFYILYIITFWMMMISINEHSVFYYSWLNIPYTYQYISLPHHINTLSLIWYGTLLLKIKEKYPLIYTVNLISTTLIVIQFFLAAFFKIQLPDNYIALGTLMPILYCALTLTSHKNTYAIFLLLGILINFVAHFNLIFDLNRFLTPYFVYSIYGILEVVLFGASIAWWSKELEMKEKESTQFALNQAIENKELKEKQNTILEEMVKTKTHELELANIQLKKYADETVQMNKLLEGQNIDLKENLNNQLVERTQNKLLTFEDFKKTYTSEKKCYEHIASIKWAKGFVCPKCGFDSYNELSKTNNSLIIRRCKRCNHPDSVTTNTLFHHLKFDIIKAFYIAYVVSSKKKITIEQMSNEIDLRKATAFTFAQKVKTAMAMSKKVKGHADGWSHLITSQIDLKSINNERI